LSRGVSLSNAIRSEAPAGMAQPGYVAGGPVGYTPSAITPTLYPPMMLAAPAGALRQSIIVDFVVEPHYPDRENEA
jgi:hypothetical protein